MARSTKKASTLLKFNYPVTVEVRETDFKWLDSARLLDVAALSQAAHVEVEVGEVKTSCCRHLVRAVVKKGIVTKLFVDPVSKTGGSPMTPDLTRLVKTVHKKLLAKRKKGPSLPMPIKQFLTSRVAELTIKSITCYQLCCFGWCLACCFSEDAIFCGKITIDTTSGPYPDPE